MCTDLRTDRQGRKFACRQCNACLTRFKRSIIGRCMAEAALVKHVWSLTLTYNDDTQFSRDGAQFFRYSDIERFTDLLRKRVERETGIKPRLRFAAAGEQGDANGRVHWHVLIFVDWDVRLIGQWLHHWTQKSPDDLASMLTIDRNNVVHLDWDVWPHGFVTVQDADYGGVSYAISYAYKSKFAVDKSLDTMRQSTAENFATGYFGCSRRPALGMPYIESILSELAAGGNVLPKMAIQIPGMRRMWHPTGALRERLLRGLREINDLVKLEHGRPARQWLSLLASSEKNEKDIKALIGDTDVQTWQEWSEEFRGELEYKARDASRRRERAQVRKRCGGKYPCDDCLSSWDDRRLASIGIVRQESPTKLYQYELVEKTSDGLQEIDRHPKNHRISRPVSGCVLAGSQCVARHFDPSARP